MVFRSEHCPQVHAIKERLRSSGQRLNTTLDNLNFWEASHEKRKQKVIANGINFDKLIFNQDLNVAGTGQGQVPRWLDVITPNTIAFLVGAAAVGGIQILVNAGQPVPELSKYLAIGDTVYFNDGAEKVATITAFATAVTADDTMIVSVAVTGVGAGNLVRQLRIPERAIDVSLSRDRNVRTFSIIYQPPLSIFDVKHAIPGSSKHEIDLVPFSDTVYQKNAIESILADKAHGVAGDFRFRVTDMLYYAARTDGPIVEQDEFFLDLEETRAQISTITANTRTQFSLDISPSTHALTVAFQDEKAETNSLFSQSKFKIQNDEELNLTNFYLRYAGELLA